MSFPFEEIVTQFRLAPDFYVNGIIFIIFSIFITLFRFNFSCNEKINKLVIYQIFAFMQAETGGTTRCARTAQEHIRQPVGQSDGSGSWAAR